MNLNQVIMGNNKQLKKITVPPSLPPAHFSNVNGLAVDEFRGSIHWKSPKLVHIDGVTVFYKSNQHKKRQPGNYSPIKFHHLPVDTE